VKKIILNSIYLLFVFITLNSYSQNDTIKGYSIEGDVVVFSFDIRDYTKISSDGGNHEMVDFEDLDIENVIVSGQFNNWTRDKWKMNKIDEYRYELIKNINDFTDEFLWEFKFIINNSFWAEPTEKISNIIPARTEDGEDLFVYNLKMFTAYPSENGNACFKLDGYQDAKKIILSGTFNKWSEEFFKMNKTEGGWELTLQLNPDEYQYKFIVDGNWIEDINNPNKKENEYDGFNSVINIKVPVTFVLSDYLNANKVVLAGSFNDWSENDYKMTRTDNGWEYKVLLSGGKHHYKFIVDGNWVLDPGNSVKEHDYNGNVNSVCMVK